MNTIQLEIKVSDELKDLLASFITLQTEILSRMSTATAVNTEAPSPAPVAEEKPVEAAPAPEKPKYKESDVQKATMELCAKGFKPQVKTALNKFADKLSDLQETDYEAYMEELGKIG